VREKSRLGDVEAAPPLDVDRMIRVDENLRDRRVGEKLLDGPEAEDVIGHRGHHPVTLGWGERYLLRLDHVPEFLHDERVQLLLRERRVVEAATAARE